MSVKKDPSGRRSMVTEFEVAGTPEEVWQAIATGPGVSSWFVPTEFEERDGKPVAMKVSFNGMEMRSEITAWDAPRMFATTANGRLPGSPPIASEWSVEARSGGKCTVRIVQSLFASTDDWDMQLESAKTGFASFLKILADQLLAHFRGQPTATQHVQAPAAGTDAESWDTLIAALGLNGPEGRAALHRTRRCPGIERRGRVAGDRRSRSMLVLRLDQACAGCSGPRHRWLSRRTDLGRDGSLSAR